MSTLGGLMRPVTDMADKQAKAGRVKSVKLKVKMKPGSAKQPAKPQFTQNQDAQ
jgi:hypothetical protein